MEKLDPRQRGALLGMRIADALSMPTHWYYDLLSLHRDYGDIVGYQKPRNPHPNSILWRSSYRPLNKTGDILHEQAQHWGKKGVHYHQFLEEGENTLSIKICSLLEDSLLAKGDHDPDAFLDRYLSFMTTPGSHQDTYIEECHRHFFTQRARGVPPRQCGRRDEKHIGGLAMPLPAAIFLAGTPERARMAFLEQMDLLHGGMAMHDAAEALLAVLLPLFQGATLGESLEQALARGDLRPRAKAHLSHPYAGWRGLSDEDVVWRVLSPACYVEFALPAALHLALAHEDDPVAGLLANANLGGDNCHRGAVLGALLGARHGEGCWPEALVRGLKDQGPLLRRQQAAAQT